MQPHRHRRQGRRRRLTVGVGTGSTAIEPPRRHGDHGEEVFARSAARRILRALPVARFEVRSRSPCLRGDLSFWTRNGGMSNVAVRGGQWGDEGKGKIVDWLSERADVVVRFQGGHNAGHTLVIGNVEYRLSLLPSGVVRPDKLSIIGNGVVVDPWALIREIEAIAEKGVKVGPDNLRIAGHAALILPSQCEMDRARGEGRGARKIGPTGRGIATAYEDKVGRRAIRVCDLAEPDSLGAKLDDLLLHHNALLRGLG